MSGADETREPSISRVDKYEVLATIGEGGMASVYRARLVGPGGASKQVALKLIHPHLSGEPDFVGMFLEEMRVAMAMAHRNIVQTFDAGKDGDSYYLVMELMERGSLGRLRERLGPGQPLPLDIALFIATEICAALAYAHAFRPEGTATRGVMHRDVSPGNILLSDQGDVKLADFGVAKVAGRITSSVGGLIKGKLSYMAPEQARGTVEPRSDLFALGAVLYWMATGRALRERPSLDTVRLGADRVELPGDLRARVPGLEPIIARCLAREPAGRPESAEALREELVPLMRAAGDGDPHARLRRFLGPAGADEAVGRGQARRLADAMMEMALAVPTHHGRGGAQPPAEGPTDISLAIEPATAVDPGPTPAPPVARRRPFPLLLVGAGALLVLSAAAIWLLWPGEPVSAPVVLSGLPDATLEQDLSRLTPPDLRPPDLGRPDLRRTPDLRSTQARRPARRPRGQGLLDLNASPWATVYVDGRRLGTTPLQGVRLPAGRHRVRLVNPERKLSASFTVRIRRGRTTRKWVRLRPSLD